MAVSTGRCGRAGRATAARLPRVALEHAPRHRTLSPGSSRSSDDHLGQRGAELGARARRARRSIASTSAAGHRDADLRRRRVALRPAAPIPPASTPTSDREQRPEQEEDERAAEQDRDEIAPRDDAGGLRAAAGVRRSSPRSPRRRFGLERLGGRLAGDRDERIVQARRARSTARGCPRRLRSARAAAARRRSRAAGNARTAPSRRASAGSAARHGPSARAVSSRTCGGCGRARRRPSRRKGTLPPAMIATPLAQPLGMGDDVGREDHRRALGGEAADQRFELALVDRVEARERLVEDHQSRFVDQRAEQLHRLRHALGQLADLPLGRIAEAVLLEQLAPAPRPSASGSPRSAPMKAIASYAFIDGIEPALLGQVADRPRDRRAGARGRARGACPRRDR